MKTITRLAVIAIPVLLLAGCQTAAPADTSRVDSAVETSKTAMAAAERASAAAKSAAAAAERAAAAAERAAAQAKAASEKADRIFRRSLRK
jgi:uncharacterized protein DUF3359